MTDLAIILILAALVGVVVLGYLHRKDIDLPPGLSHIGEFASLFAISLAGALAWVALSGRDDKTTAGDVAQDETDAIDQQTTEDIEDAPDEPDHDYADAAGDFVHDAADEAGAELGDGFQPEHPDDDLHPDLLPVDFDDDG